MSLLQEIASPCIGVCRLDERRICVGCWRSIDEIVAWRSLNNEEKQRVIAVSEQRRILRGNENK